jgi:hypothetical protein
MDLPALRGEEGVMFAWGVLVARGGEKDAHLI